MAKRVYFAFHYDDVVNFRANVVRNHKLTKGAEAAGYYDHSIWEEAKKKGDLAIKRMINSELEDSSVTAVLIGSLTYSRRWVRYEIMKSVERGNKLLGIHINNIAGKDKMTKSLGANPFEFLGHEISKDGKKGTPTVWNGEKWVYYSDSDSFAITEQPLINREKIYSFQKGVPNYDWVENDGFNNFSNWIA